MCQYYTSNSCPYAAKFETAGWRLHASGLGKKTLRTCSGKHFLLFKKNTIRNQFLVKLFPVSFYLSAFEVTFTKLLTPPSASKKKSRQLKGCTQMTFSHRSFSRQSLLGFFYSRSFSCALYSDDSSSQVSGEKLRKY